MFSGICSIDIFFAYIYYYLIFKRQRKHFIFQKEILLGRKEEIENLIRELEPEIEVLQHIVGQFEQGKDIEHITAEKTTVNLHSGRKYQISKRLASDVDFMGVVTDYTIVDLSILNSLGKTIGRMSFEDAGYHTFKEHLIYRKNQLTRCEQRLETIIDYSPGIWSYWDFCYFSASTQTTLGYGDILPNSTLARMLVIIQVFLGLAILVLAINFVILLFKS